MEQNPLPSLTLKSTNLQLAAAFLSGLTDATLQGFEDDPFDKTRKAIIISYPASMKFEADKIIQTFEDKTIVVNLFYYTRNLNYLRDKLFKRGR